jgi:hypothetical protein
MYIPAIENPGRVGYVVPHGPLLTFGDRALADITPADGDELVPGKGVGQELKSRDRGGTRASMLGVEQLAQDDARSGCQSAGHHEGSCRGEEKEQEGWARQRKVMSGHDVIP